MAKSSGPNGKQRVRKPAEKKARGAEPAPPPLTKTQVAKRLRMRVRDLETCDRINSRRLTHSPTGARKGCAQIDALPKGVHDRVHDDCMGLKGYTYTAEWLQDEGYFSELTKLQVCRLVGLYRRGMPGLCKLKPFSKRLIERAKQEVDKSLDLHQEITRAALRLRDRIAIREAREHRPPQPGDGRPMPAPERPIAHPDDFDADTDEPGAPPMPMPSPGVVYYRYDKTISSDVELYMRMLGKLHEIRMDLGYAGGKTLGAAVDAHPEHGTIREKHGKVVEATMSQPESSAKVLSIFKQLTERAQSQGAPPQPKPSRPVLPAPPASLRNKDKDH